MGMASHYHSSDDDQFDPQRDEKPQQLPGKLSPLPDEVVTSDVQSFRKFDELRLAGDTDGALKLGHLLIAQPVSEVLPEHRELVGNTAKRLAKLHARVGDHDSAVDCLTYAISLASQDPDPAIELSRLWRKVGSERVLQKNYAAAETAFKHALHWIAESDTKPQPEALSIRLNLSLALQLQGDSQGAITEENNAFELASHFSEDTYRRAGITLQGFATHAYQLGIPEKAERSLMAAKKFFTDANLTDQRVLDRVDTDLALACAAQKKFDRANAIVESLLHKEQQLKKGKPTYNLLAYEKLHAEFLHQSGQPIRAANVLYRRFKNATVLFPKNDHRLLPYLLDATFASVDTADRKRTIELAQKAENIELDRRSPIISTLRCFQAICRERYGLALRHLSNAQKAYETRMRDKYTPDLERKLAYIRLQSAYILIKQDRAEEAEPHINFAMNTFAQYENDPTPPSSSIRTWEMKALLEQSYGALDRAEAAFERALYLTQQNQGHYKSRLGAVTFENAAGLYRAKHERESYEGGGRAGDKKREKSLLEEAVIIRNNLGYDTSESTLSTYERIAEILEEDGELERAQEVRQEIETRKGMARIQKGNPITDDGPFGEGLFGTDI